MCTSVTFCFLYSSIIEQSLSHFLEKLISKQIKLHLDANSFIPIDLQVVYSREYIKEAMVEPLKVIMRFELPNYPSFFLMQSNKAD